MSERKGSAVWEGTLEEGKGSMKLGNNGYEGPSPFSRVLKTAPGQIPKN